MGNGFDCLVCGCRGPAEEFLNLGRVPASLGAPPRPDEIDSELVGHLRVVQCSRCSHLYNRDIDPSLIREIYSREYSSGHATTPAMVERLAQIVDEGIGASRIRGRRIVEIGAGDFTVSSLLLDRGAKEVVALEPSAAAHDPPPGIRHLPAFLEPGSMPGFDPGIGGVVMRHVLEHVLEPVELLHEIANVLALGAWLYVEVPDIEDILGATRLYDFCYEHLSYFSPALLTEVLEDLGFRILVASSWAGHQHFGLLAELSTDVGSGRPTRFLADRDLRAEQGAALRRARSAFSEGLRQVFSPGKHVGIYGAGAHGIGATVLAGLDAKTVDCMLDRNPEKAGRVSPVGHIPITIPESERLSVLDDIVVVASLHQDHIIDDLIGEFGFRGRIWGTYPRLELVKEAS